MNAEEKKREESNQARLEELQQLTGCPINFVIEGRCEELGCQNAGLQALEEGEFPIAFCQKVRRLIQEDSRSVSEEEAHYLEKSKALFVEQKPKAKAPEPIIDTHPHLRCVL